MRCEDRVPNPIIYLFHEGKTELGYLQGLARNRMIRIVPEPSVSSPVILLQSAVRFAVMAVDELRDNPDAEIWVVFDYDAKAQDMAKAATALDKCPDRCAVTCKVRDIRQCDAKDVLGRIHVAFMSPCIEVWGIMCTEKGARMDKFPEDRHVLQRQLHDLMPRYNHARGALFDLTQMSCTDKAIERAKSWARTHGDFPACLTAPHYAGIYPLVEKILASPPLNVETWRRR